MSFQNFFSTWWHQTEHEKEAVVEQEIAIVDLQERKKRLKDYAKRLTITTDSSVVIRLISDYDRVNFPVVDDIDLCVDPWVTRSYYDRIWGLEALYTEEEFKAHAKRELKERLARLREEIQKRSRLIRKPKFSSHFLARNLGKEIRLRCPQAIRRSDDSDAL